jgi:hypothetical protein
MTAKILLVLLFLSGCATKVPESVIKEIHAERMAGYWVLEGYNGKKNFVKISCDGEIEFDLTDHTQKFFNEDKDQGKITRIHELELTYKSWTSVTRGLKYQKPTEKKGGCWEFTINGLTMKGEPADCTKPKLSLAESFQEALQSKSSKCYSR